MQSVRKWSITRVALSILVSLCVANLVSAQETNAQAQTGKIDRTAAASTGSEKSSSEKNSAEKIAEPKAVSAKPATNSAAAKVNSSEKTNSTEKVKDETKADAAVKNTPAKRVDSAVINLQTTVTGNQEQPRVMYILPWQSPAPEDVDFESLENQTKSVFGHIERDELRRELEATEKKATEKK